MREEQKKAAEFARVHGMNLDPQVRFLDLASEVGELSKELLKSSDYGRVPPALTEEMEWELGDSVFSLLCLCEALSVDAQKALGAALAKYEKRYEETGQAGSGK